jgi:hypothetical protein
MGTVQWQSPVSCAAAVDAAHVPAFTVRETHRTGAPKPRLLDCVRDAVRTRRILTARLHGPDLEAS